MSTEQKKYRLLKDLPGLTAGTEFMQHPKAYNRWYPVSRFENGEHIDNEKSIYGFLRADIDNPGWFEEVKLPTLPERIEVLFEYLADGENGYGIYWCKSTKQIPPDKFPAIKQAIEAVLNNDV